MAGRGQGDGQRSLLPYGLHQPQFPAVPGLGVSPLRSGAGPAPARKRQDVRQEPRQRAFQPSFPKEGPAGFDHDAQPSFEDRSAINAAPADVASKPAGPNEKQVSATSLRKIALTHPPCVCYTVRHCCRLKRLPLFCESLSEVPTSSMRMGHCSKSRWASSSEYQQQRSPTTPGKLLKRHLTACGGRLPCKTTCQSSKCSSTE